MRKYMNISHKEEKNCTHFKLMKQEKTRRTIHIIIRM